MLDHLSYSSINTYLLCGRAWRRRYIDKEQTPTSSALVLGSAFHNAIEAAVQGADLESQFQQSWLWQLERNPDVDWGQDTQSSVKATGERMVKSKSVQDLLGRLRENFDGDPEKIEKRVELRVPGVPVPIIGYIDLITKDGVPGDFKTAARMWRDGKADEELQPLFYLAALNQAGIEVPGWMFRHYVFTKTTRPEAKVFEVQHKPSEIFGLFEIIKAAWRGIEAGVYLLNTSTWKCSPKYCEFWSTCRAKYI